MSRSYVVSSRTHSEQARTIPDLSNLAMPIRAVAGLSHRPQMWPGLLIRCHFLAISRRCLGLARASSHPSLNGVHSSGAAPQQQ